MTGPQTTQEKLTALCRVLAEDPALARQLASLGSLSELPDAICRVAAQHDIALAPAEVSDALAQVKAGQGGNLDVSDMELEAVAGGHKGIETSACLLLIGCAFASVVYAIEGKNCGKELGF